MIDGLHKIFAHDKVEIEFVKEYMGKYKSNRQEWAKYEMFDPHK